MSSAAAVARAKLFRAVHAEGLKRGFDHGGLHDLCCARFDVASMHQMTNQQLYELYHGWTGKGMKRTSPLPRRGYGKQGELEMVSSADLEALAKLYHDLSWGEETRRAFTRRVLRGREQIRTRADWWKVFSGARAIQRRQRTPTKRSR